MSGTPTLPVSTASSDVLTRVATASPALTETSPRDRARALVATADRLDESAYELVRSVAFQNAPQSLPPPVRDDNPWHIPRWRSPEGLSSQWGSLTGQY